MVDYMYDEPQKKFDLLIPVAIILIVAVIFLAKTTTMFCGIPAVGGFLCGTGGEARLAVIGSFDAAVPDEVLVNGAEMKNWLDGEYGAIYNIHYVEYDPDTITFLADQLLKEYDMVVLVGDREYKRPVKDAIEGYLEKGGKILLIGDAALKDPDDPTAIGWGKMGMPVVLKSYIEEKEDDIPILDLGEEGLTYTIQIATMHHPILDIYEGMTKITSDKFKAESCQKGKKFIQVDPKGARTVAFLKATITEEETTDEEETTKDVYLPAIVETDSALGGKVVYFAFDPGCSVNMMISTIEYIAGKDLKG